MPETSLSGVVARVLGLSAIALSAAAADSGSSSPGRALFEEKCAMCHRADGMGTGLLARRYPKGQELLEARTNLTVDFVSATVRNGVGNMPPLSRAEVSDAQLASIARYLSKQAP